MPQARVWTATADAIICELRRNGETWATIGYTLGLSRNTVIERGRRLRAEAPLRTLQPIVEKLVSDDPNRASLPAGHPITWGLLSSESYPA